MKNAFLTIALTTAMLMGSMVFTESAQARPRAWRYYGGPAQYYGGYYGSAYPPYYSRYYAPRYYSYPYRYSYGGPGVYFGGPRAGAYWRF